MRHDQADEADGAGDRDAGARRERRERDQSMLEALDRNAEMPRLGLAQRERVQAGRATGQQDQRDR